jgi:TolB-like protein/Tfp pilus assembly protein PilF
MTGSPSAPPQPTPPSAPRSFLDELKRRKVVRAALIYLAGAVATIEVADVLVPVLGLPDWTMRLVVGLVAIGFPVVLGVAWAFDLTDRGLTADDPAAKPQPGTAHWLSAKTVALSVGMLAVGLGLGWVVRTAFLAPSPPVGERSIAVIPFDNLSLDEENAFLAVGLQDEILTQLGKVADLRVISRSSVMRYEPGPDRASIPDIGQELDARWIVEGSVARVGQNVRINVQLIESATDSHAWAEAYDGDLIVQGLLDFQAQVARRVAESLQATIRPDEGARIASLPTSDTQAYEHYLRANELFAHRRELELLRALELYDEASALDSTFAEAHAGKALVYAVLPFYSDATPVDAYRSGFQSANRALALDSTVAAAHAAIGDMVFHRDYDAVGGEAALRKAIEFNPSFAQAWDWLSETQLARRRFEDALASSRQALRLDPLSARLNLMLGSHLMSNGELDAAIEQLARTVDMDPGLGTTHEALGRAFMLAGRYEEASASFRRYAQAVGDDDARILERVALALASGTDTELARVTQELDAVTETSWSLSAVQIAVAYVWVGRFETALDWLERGFELNEVTMPFIDSMSVLDPIRDEPRFRALVRQMGLD